jgi:hypothetical protein
MPLTTKSIPLKTEYFIKKLYIALFFLAKTPTFAVLSPWQYLWDVPLMSETLFPG